jgi:hypothetical protein
VVAVEVFTRLRHEDFYPTEQSEGVVHPAECNEDVYPTECNEGVVVAAAAVASPDKRWDY